MQMILKVVRYMKKLLFSTWLNLTNICLSEITFGTAQLVADRL